MMFPGKNCLVFILIAMLAAASGCATADTESTRRRARALEDLGASYLREGNPNLAVKYLMEAAEADPGNPHIARSLGIAYRELELTDRAAAEFLRALKLKTDFPQAWNDLGVTYAGMQRWDDAISCFEKAAGTISYATPHYAYLNLGLVYYRKGDARRAAEYFKEALRIDPLFVPAYENLGLAHEALGAWDEAVTAYKSAVSTEPDSANAHLLLGKLYRRLGRRAEAADALRKAAAADPNGPMGKEAVELLERSGETAAE